MKLGILIAAVFVMGAAVRRPLLERAPDASLSRPNPFENAPSAAKAGEKIYQRECSSCHGQDAQGSRKAPALNSPDVRQAQPGALFWVLRNGSLASGMPSFSHLPEPQRWQVITYLKNLNSQER
jgi:mono/diheme cytochrome c family protein